jgi:sugar/nucleoside kinase (ribokinase family)
MSKSHSPSSFETTSDRPISVGAGFLALDWLLLGKKRVKISSHYAGGSCGNVLAILAYLGWRSYPVARLGKDAHARSILEDLRNCKVDTDFVRKEATGATPVIVLRISETSEGKPSSRFEWKHPRSGAWLPRYRPLPQSHVRRVTPNLPVAAVFYFDRAEPSTLLLAQSMSEKGAVIFFEPSSCKNDELFTKCLAVSDIVKYSAQRIATPPRLKLNSSRPGPWRYSPSLPALDFKDATGCGDWCSAGIISRIAASGRESFLELEEDEIAESIKFGQTLAAINCEFEGARGPMYHMESEDFLTQASALMSER